MDAPNFFLIALIGFLAQTIDGALGMAYGVSANSFLLGLGLSPVAASASVHISEVFSSLASGISHFGFGNVNTTLLKKLIIPGVIGGIIGAYILTTIPGDIFKPFVAIYLFIMGVFILVKAFRRIQEDSSHKKFFPLAFLGGFFDSIGGGGWGPIVSATLIGRGHKPRFVVGTVSAAEFFVTVVQAATFIALLKSISFSVVLPLVIGGVIAAPISAYVCKIIPAKILMVLVGILVIILSVRTIILTVI